MKGLRFNVWKYYTFSFVVSLAFFGGVLIPFFTQWGGITQFQIQFLQAWFMFWIFVLEVPTGAVADYLGRKYSIALGAFIFAMGAVVYSTYPAFWIFLIAEFLMAMGMALQSGADEALLYDSLKAVNLESETKKIMGRARSLELLAIGLAAPIGSLIAQRFGVMFPMLFTAIPMTVGAIIALTFKEPIKTGVKESRRYLDVIGSGIRYARDHKTLKFVALDSLTVAAAAYFVIWLYQRLLQQIGIPVLWFGVFHLILIIVQIIVNQSFDLFERIFGGAYNYLRLTALIVGVGFVAVGVVTNIWTIMLLILLSGGFGLTRMTYLSAHINSLINSSDRATVLSALSMFRRSFLIVLNPLVGFFIDKSINLTLICLGIIPILISIFPPIKKAMVIETKAT